MDNRSGRPRVLIFSLRNIFRNALFRCAHFEFEDIICQIDHAELLAPRVDASSWRSTAAMRLAYHAPVFMNPRVQCTPAEKQYDVLFTICGNPHDLLMFNAVSNLRDVCRTSVCLLDELWAKQISNERHFLPILAKFDVIMQYNIQTVKPLSEYIGKRCAYLPPGVDAILFCPYPDRPERVIDVYSLGRRSHITHQKLLKMTREGNFFYLHDSIDGSEALDLREHRALTANLAKRSRYFLVNPGKFDEPEHTGPQVEFGSRYFEGAASGAIMVGERPNNEAFPKLFDWPDAVIQMPYNSNDIDLIIRDLDRDPERQDRMRRTGVTQALMRHDWVYRWETILEAVGLEPMQWALERKNSLRKLAEIVSATEIHRGNAEGERSISPDEVS
jgi:hypothetical protein